MNDLIILGGATALLVWLAASVRRVRAGEAGVVPHGAGAHGDLDADAAVDAGRHVTAGLVFVPRGLADLVCVPLGAAVLEAAEQALCTRDGIRVRAQAALAVRVADPVRAAAAGVSSAVAISASAAAEARSSRSVTLIAFDLALLELRLALRDLVAEHTLGHLERNGRALDTALMEALRARCAVLGLAIERVGLVSLAVERAAAESDGAPVVVPRVDAAAPMPIPAPVPVPVAMTPPASASDALPADAEGAPIPAAQLQSLMEQLRLQAAQQWAAREPAER